MYYRRSQLLIEWSAYHVIKRRDLAIQSLDVVERVLCHGYSPYC